MDMLPASSSMGAINNKIQAVVNPSIAGACRFQSWRLAVEANNLTGWKTVPTGLHSYLKDYMYSNQYLEDFKLVIDEALNYLETLNDLPNDGKNIWVFDIDETLLSNLPYFSKQGFGWEALTSPLFFEWVATSNCTLLPEALRLYDKVVSLGIKVVLVTGRKEHLRDPTIKSLQKAGFYTWEMLVLRSGDLADKPGKEYKSTHRAKLETELGYRIIGNIGDQWSDLLGPSPGKRVFKLPNPMYYIP